MEKETDLLIDTWVYVIKKGNTRPCQIEKCIIKSSLEKLERLDYMKKHTDDFLGLRSMADNNIKNYVVRLGRVIPRPNMPPKSH